MKIKLIIFDLDGVLVSSKDLHYESLNRALEFYDKKYIINRDEHLTKYDGNSTTSKLKMLSIDKGLPIELYDDIWKIKQDKTLEIIDLEYKFDERIRNVLKQLKSDGYQLYCASNSIFNTVKLILLRKGLMEYFDYFISNQEVKYPKPNSEIYLACISRMGLAPKECIILEDSHIGRTAAMNSGAHLLPIETPECVTYDKINSFINNININMENVKSRVQWEAVDNKINIVVPCAGRGSRFADSGLYSFPKPLIDVLGKPMIQMVVENLNINGHYIFIVQEEHVEKYNLNHLLNLIAPNCTIIPINKITEGAACTVLLAEKFINNENPLLIANSDQYLEWDSNKFMYSMMNNEIDGGISTFKGSMHPKWSFSRTDKDGYVDTVREKEPMENSQPTTGIYLWKKGKDFVKYANVMIDAGERVKNEFYVAPVYNYAIKDGKKIKNSLCDGFHGTGTPEDLNSFIEYCNKNEIKI
jgi:HAD superfamily hydrolase (TIGR01509 family)